VNVIRFESLTKAYGGHLAVREFTLEVRPGQIYALLGPNGAGKTTALRCLATLLRPSSGRALVDGVDGSVAPLEARRRLGFLGASMGLYDRMTARELVEYFGRLHGLAGPSLRARVDQLLDRFGVDAFADRFCGLLSRGQRRRVAAARAVVHDPPALVLDEPTTGLDVLSGETIYAFMREERRRGKAILFATHRMEEVDLLADRIGVLRQGTLVAEGTVADLLERTGTDNLTRAFLRLEQG
jgi:sodium transport system ATP-binding protein